MANIMILNGAARKNGNTAKLIKAFTEGAIGAGNQVKEFYLQDMVIAIQQISKTRNTI